MLISHDRERQINALIYFSRRFPRCTPGQAFTLLALWDFRHFVETERLASGLKYDVRPNGLVPVALEQELAYPKNDFAAAISTQDGVLLPKADFDRSHFSRRQIRIMDEIADRYASPTKQIYNLPKFLNQRVGVVLTPKHDAPVPREGWHQFEAQYGIGPANGPFRITIAKVVRSNSGWSISDFAGDLKKTHWASKVSLCNELEAAFRRKDLCQINPSEFSDSLEVGLA